MLLVASLEEKSDTVHAALKKFRASEHGCPAEVAVAIGPEGDFSPAELAALRSYGAIPVTLGPWTLRSDTAATAAAAIIGAELQEKP